MAKIFLTESDNREFNHPEKYAFLNWYMDDGMGTNRQEQQRQQVSDEYHMGRGYLGNALLSLYLIIGKNECNVADIIVFPILFDVWHGLELWLKSACTAIELLFGDTIKKKRNHDIYDYYDKLDAYIKVKGFQFIKDNALVELEMLISEFRKVNANFDFARYSFDVKSDYQFYNAPYESDKQWQKSNAKIENNKVVPNTCLDLAETFNMVLNTFITFGNFVECLNILLDTGEVLSDEGYREYIDTVVRCERLLNTDSKIDVLDELINLIL